MRIVEILVVLGVALLCGCSPPAKPVGGEVAFQLVVPLAKSFPKDAKTPAAPHVAVQDWARKKAFPLVPRPAFVASDFKEVYLRRNEAGRAEIELVLTLAAAMRFGTFTGVNTGQVMAVLVDGRVATAFKIEDRIDSGRVRFAADSIPVTEAWHAAIVGASSPGKGP